MRHFSNGRIRQQFRFLRRQFLQDDTLPLSNVLSEDVVAEVLEETECSWVDRIYSPLVKCQGGFSINWNSTIRYQGDTRALNVFLDKIAKCPAVEVFVSFKKLADNCDWRVHHDGVSNTFHVVVNLQSHGPHLEDLVVPSISGPKQKKPD